MGTLGALGSATRAAHMPFIRAKFTVADGVKVHIGNRATFRATFSVLGETRS